MTPHYLTSEKAITALRSGAGGLDTAEALRRRAEFGPNKVERIHRRPLVLSLLAEFIHFFALILWVASALCFFAEWRDPGSGMVRLGWAIIVVILVNGLFAFWQEARAEQALRSLEALLPRTVAARRNGALIRIPAEDLVPGDVVELEDGDIVPGDARVLEAQGLLVNLSVLTGESAPVPRNAEPSESLDPLHAANALPAGAALVAGRAVALITATGMRTSLGQVAHLTQSTTSGPGTLQLEIARVSRTIAMLALAIGGLFFLLGRQLGLSFWQNLVFSVGIIVANVPEGLLPTVTLALAMAGQRMAKRNALIRNLGAVETLGAATVICTDKTGTLTENRMVVRRLHASGQTVDIAEAGRNLPRELWLGLRFAHGLKREDGHWHGDPMEVALQEAGVKQLGDLEAEPLGLLPFDAQRRRFSVAVNVEGRRLLLCKGAPEAVLQLCRGSAENNTLDAVQTLAREGMRVIAFAWRELARGEPLTLESERDLTFAGLAALEDPPRAEVKEAIATCRKAGIRVFMVTGDHPLTALAIARQIGLVTESDAVVHTGEEIRRMPDSQLQLLLDAKEMVFARLDPDQKHRIVLLLRKKGEVVAVTGDGVNDAPALRAADIGIAMGLSGTEVARDAADLVLTDDHFATIVAAVEEGRAIYTNIRRFLTYHMTSNCGELLPYLAFALFRVPLPLTVIQILAIDLGTDMVPALALGAEPPDHDTMARSPRPRGEHLLNRQVIARSYGILGLVEGAAGLAAYAAVLRLGGWTWGTALASNHPLYLQATTACLCGIIALQMTAVFCCRHESRSLFHSNPFSNRILLVGVGMEAVMLLALNVFPPFQVMLGTSMVPIWAWLTLPPFMLLMVTFEEGRKALQRRRQTA
jgi:sodium/potassium-transporting ATPase subunit alpha